MATTELDKWAATVGDIRTVEAFLEWAQTRGLALRTADGGFPAERIGSLLAEFYDIDLRKLDDERRALLDSCRQSVPR